jgi:hypothetical protein
MPSDDLIKDLKEKIVPFQQQIEQNEQTLAQRQAEFVEQQARKKQREGIARDIGFTCVNAAKALMQRLAREVPLNIPKIDPIYPDMEPRSPRCTATLAATRDFNQTWTVTANCAYNDATQKVTVAVILSSFNSAANPTHRRDHQFDLPARANDAERQVTEFIETSIKELVVEYMRVRAEVDKQ